MLGTEKVLDTVRVAIHRGSDGYRNCCLGSLSIAKESRTPSRARRASSSAPSGVLDPGMAVATRRVRRSLVQRRASSTGAPKTEPSSPNSKERSMNRPPTSDTTTPLSNTSVGPRRGNAASFTRDFKGERRRTLRSGEYRRATAAAAKKANRVPMLIGLVNHWFTAEGCNEVPVITMARKATIGTAVGIQPQRKASRCSLSNGSEGSWEVVVHRERSLPRSYTMSMRPNPYFADRHFTPPLTPSWTKRRRSGTS